MRAHALIIAVSATLLAAPAFAGQSCSPSDNTARILKSPNPNDVHPDWRGESTIGTSWSLLTTGAPVKTDFATFLKGDLYSPRGGVVNRGVYVIAREWDCVK